MSTPSGRWLSRSYGHELAAADSAISMLMVHRAELHRQLLSALPSGAVTFGARVEHIEDHGETAAMDLTVGGERTTAAAEVLVGADGINSVSRKQIWPDAAPPHYAGFTAWRGVTDQPFELAAQSQTLGPAAEFGLTQLLDGRVYWFGTGDDPEGHRASDERADVLRRFGAWHAPISEVVEASSPAAVLRHDVYRLPRPFRSFVKGRVVLVGDAAHAMLPTLGQGGCLALEDAVVLSSLLAGAEDVAAALAEYDALRRPRAERLSKMSDQIGRVTRARNPVLVAIRSTVMAAMPAKVGIASIARTVDWEPPTATGARL